MSERKHGMPRFLVVGAAAVLASATIGSAIGLLLARKSSGAGFDANPIASTFRRVPARVQSIPLLDADGRKTNLAALRGRIVVLADVMTSCQEECPITTGALLEVEQRLADAHLLDKVTVVEVTVDPWRDSPSRLRAYKAKFGVPWVMLTGSIGNIRQLWSWFGVLYERVPESKPPDINWENGKPYTFDIDHSDDAFILDDSGNERGIVEGNANVSGKLSKRLSKLLDAQGRQDLRHAGFGSWTPSDMLRAVGAVLGQTIPLSDQGS